MALLRDDGRYNANQIRTEPYDTDRHKSRTQQIKLYFVGHELIMHRGDEEFLPVFEVKGQAVTMPPLGEFIVVDEIMAKDLRFKSMYADSNGINRYGLLTEEEGGAEIAAYLLKARDSGIPFEEIDFDQFKAAHLSEHLSNEALAEVIQLRGFDVPPELIDMLGINDDDEDSEEKAQDLTVVAAPKKRGRPPKNNVEED